MYGTPAIGGGSNGPSPNRPMVGLPYGSQVPVPAPPPSVQVDSTALRQAYGLSGSEYSLQDAYACTTLDRLRHTDRFLGLFRNPWSDGSHSGPYSWVGSSLGIAGRSAIGTAMGHMLSQPGTVETFKNNWAGHIFKTAEKTSWDKLIGFEAYNSNGTLKTMSEAYNLSANRATAWANLPFRNPFKLFAYNETANHLRGALKYGATGLIKYLPAAGIGLLNTGLAFIGVYTAFSKQHEISMQKGSPTAMQDALLAGGKELGKFATGYAVGSIAFGAVLPWAAITGIGMVGALPLLPLVAAGVAGVVTAKLFDAIFGPSVEKPPETPETQGVQFVDAPDPIAQRHRMVIGPGSRRPTLDMASMIASEEDHVRRQFYA